MFKKFAWFFKEYKGSYILAFVLMVMSVGAQLIPPLLIGRATDLIAAGQLYLRGLLFTVGLFALCIVLEYGLTYAYSYLLFRGTDLIGREARRRLVGKLLRQGPLFYEENTTGSLMSKATSDVRNIQDMAGFGMMSMVMTVLYPLLIVAVMGARLSFRLTLASVAPLVLMVVLTRFISPRLYQAYKEAQNYFDGMNDIVLENVNGARVIRAFNRQKSEMARFAGQSQGHYRANMDQVRHSSAVNSLTKVIPGLSYLIAFGLGAYFIAQSLMTIGDLVAFISYLNLLVRPSQVFGEFINVFQLASASMDRIWDIWSYEEDLVDKEDAISYEGGGDIVFDGFDFNFSDGTKGLEAIDLRLGHGQTLGVVGKVGSGKTTLLKQVLRLYPVKEESLYMGGRPVEDYKMRSIRAKSGYVPQDHILFSASIRDNISFGNDYTEEEIDRAVSLADFKKDLEAMPEGLDTQVGERGVSLSGGQKQRLSIARALIKDPEILILDDSLSAVDAKTEQNIIDKLAQVSQGRTSIIAAHRLSGIMHADEIIVLDEGRIVERGSHEELIELGGWYRDQFEAQKLEDDDHGQNQA